MGIRFLRSNNLAIQYENKVLSGGHELKIC